MKGSSHRLPTADPPDDWVDGSWTVDCVCGVNFDDGEEMVDCDECGVWVHTRCSRYVKSEKSFTCDKCKRKNCETEIAQCLLELPTQTLRRDKNPMRRRQFRLWTDIPMEERVHVQGVPGGDPELFLGAGVSSILTPQLWKCTGYVPKKFNFRYKEFPCWDDDDGDVKPWKEEGDKGIGERNGNQVDNGAGVLLSLSKDKEITSPFCNGLAGVETSMEEKEVVSSSGQVKKLDVVDSGVRMIQDRSTKERSSENPTVFHSRKPTKEGSDVSKYQNVKKKAVTAEKERDAEKKVLHASQEDRGSKDVEVTTQGDNNGERASVGLADQVIGAALVEPASVLTHKNDSLTERHPKEDGSRQVGVSSDNSSKTDGGMALLEVQNESRNKVVKEEVKVSGVENVGENGAVTTRVIEMCSRDNKIVEDVATAGPEFDDVQNPQDSDIEKTDLLHAGQKWQSKVDGDVEKANSPDDVNLGCVQAPIQHQRLSVDLFSANNKRIQSSTGNTETKDEEVQRIDRVQVVGNTKVDESDVLAGYPHHSKQEPAGPEGSKGLRQRSSGLKHDQKLDEEGSKSPTCVTTHLKSSYLRKTVFHTKSSSTAASLVVSNSGESCMPPTAQYHETKSREKEMLERNGGMLKDNASADVVRDEKSGRPKKVAKETPRSLSSTSKTPHSAKLPNAWDSNRGSSDSKDLTGHSLSRAHSASNVTTTPSLGDQASSRHSGSAEDQDKDTGSALYRSQKGHSASRILNRGNTALVRAPAVSNVPAALSDEELALLLHQELNSSPRVPRVPRMRHAGSLPHLASPTATSMLMKRTSTGGKDNGLASRKKTKDLEKEVFHGSLDVDGEAKKTDRIPSSPDNRKQNSGCSMDLVPKREADTGSVKSLNSTQKSKPPSSKENLNSCLSSSSEASGQNLSSTQQSQRNASIEDQGTVGCATNRTLPGLIAEIMIEGKRMTYEELCNAVLPHWPHLRKHNGERYAYSSHSQAVLDCLRNRSEWARLVDRGPKNLPQTNASRKRRKFDVESASIESEDNEEDVQSKSSESRHEEYPRGKRQTRKRRRLALQGRGVIRRSRVDDASDDESESYSNTSEGNMSSEEEIQGGGTSPIGKEASASSDELR